MKYTMKLFAIVLLLISFMPLAAQDKKVSKSAPIIIKVEHFYVFADESSVEKLFQLFRDEFRLPQVWAFKDWGSYKSGGVSLGNVVLEFATYRDPENKLPKTEFQGIVFEPVVDAVTTVAILKSRGIPHEDPIAENPGWTIIPFTKIPPDNVFIMLCDYKDRRSVADGRSKAAGTLAKAGGGKLGIRSLKEIVVGVKDVKEAADKWQLALGRKIQSSSGVFKFDAGPNIRLVQTDAPGIQEIRVKIKSTVAAKRFLDSRQMLGNDAKGGLTIKPSAIGGLSILLVRD